MLDKLIGDNFTARIIEGSLLLILLYLVLANATGFSQVIKASGGVYADSVRALQAR